MSGSHLCSPRPNRRSGPLKIDMVMDLVCSWCPIGYMNMKHAIEQLQIDVDFQFLPFELNPSMPAEGELISDYFKRRMRWSQNKLTHYQTGLVHTASKAGVVIDFANRTHYYNSHKAHLLLRWAHNYKLQTDFYERLIKAYFEQGLDISQDPVLLDIIESLGLNRQAGEEALSSDVLHQAVIQKKQDYQAFNINRIPTFILDGKIQISGSLSVLGMIEALEKYAQKPISPTLKTTHII